MGRPYNNPLMHTLPIDMYMTYHTQICTPVRTITGVRYPWGIALNNKEQLVVSEFGGRKVSIMERDGKRVQTIECDKFRDICGVATGPDGAIYVTDRSAHCLFKFNRSTPLNWDLLYEKSLESACHGE